MTGGLSFTLFGNITYNPAGARACQFSDVQQSTAGPGLRHGDGALLPMLQWPMFETSCAGVFDPVHGWVVIMRHERVFEGPAFPLTMFMGKDPSHLNFDVANQTQTVFSLDNATLGYAAAQSISAPWLKAFDLR